MESTLAILKWAAGCPVELPAGGDVCDSDLIAWLARHRLVERFLRRLEQGDGSPRFPHGRPAWRSPMLIANLATRRARARHRFWQQSEALHEIVGALNGRRRSPYPWPVVIFKGCATYALTNELHNIHESGDIDILCNDPGEFQSVAQELGYSAASHDRYLHEHATLDRSGIVIELHRYIEVVSYPGDARDTSYDPRDNPGCWWQRSAYVRRNPSVYDEIAAYCTGGLAPGTAGLGFPNATLGVAILCAHALMDYVYPCELCPLPVRLGELADIRDLCRLDSFDPKLLQQIVVRMDARDSIDFAGHLIGEYFGVNPLGGAGPSISGIREWSPTTEGGPA